jgi:hypothetical protein
VTTSTNGATSTGGTGPTSSSRSTSTPLSATVEVISDSTAPTFVAAPALGLRAGTVNKTGTPVYLTWRATDNALLARTIATSPTAATFGPAPQRWNTTVGPGVRTFTLIAADAAGNSATASVTRRATQVPETAATRSGRWLTARKTSYLDGAAVTSTVRSASLTWTFTGRSVAWIAARTAFSGQALVYLDGAKVATVDLRSAATAFRQAVWTRNGLTAGSHRLTIVVVGTTGRPTVISDGIAYLS